MRYINLTYLLTYCGSGRCDCCCIVSVVHQPVQPVSQRFYGSSAHVQDTSSTSDAADAMQIFLERAEKSGIRLETLPESNT